MAAVMIRTLFKENAAIWQTVTHAIIRTTCPHTRYSISKRMIYNLGPCLSQRRQLFEVQDQSRILKTRNCINTVVVDNFINLFGCIQFKSTFAKSTNTRFTLPGDRNISSSGQKLTLDRSSSEGTSSPTKKVPEAFDNCQLAYGRKSAFELLRALAFFFLCRFSFVTDNAVQIMGLFYNILGHRFAETLIKKAVYDQFVAGESASDVTRVAQQLRLGGVASILCVPIETDDRVSTRESTETFLDSNLDKVLASIALSTQLGDPLAMTQFRISALVASDLTKTIGRFCEETIHNSEVISGMLDAMSGRHVNFSELPGWAEFPQERTEELQKGLQRLGKIKDALENRDVIALVDAEYTAINPALRLFSLCLMKVCNIEYAKVFYTYQAYLKATRKNLEQDLTFAATNGFGFGVKLVRGAYMITERRLARELGYQDPVNETFELTSASYHSCLDLLLGSAAASRSSSLRFMIASHNEATIRYAIDRMNQLQIPKDGSDVFFGQLYGMADHVTFTLGNQGYRVYKSIPYGPVQETLPYLARRAQENKAILANARRERQLVAKALVDRITFTT